MYAKYLDGSDDDRELRDRREDEERDEWPLKCKNEIKFKKTIVMESNEVLCFTVDQIQSIDRSSFVALGQRWAFRFHAVVLRS